MTVVEKNNEIVRMISYKKKAQEIIADTWCGIDEDYSLIRHLCKETEYRDISFNIDGYTKIKRADGTVTTIHRFILEYYANFDEKLKLVLNDLMVDIPKIYQYQINHINKEKRDNRLVNLEIVSKQGNVLHRDNKPYENEVIMSSAELQAIQKRVMGNRQQETDKKFLKRASGKFNKGIREEEIYDEIIKWRYLEFNYVKLLNRENQKNSNCNSFGRSSCKGKDLTDNCTKSIPEHIKKYLLRYIELLLERYENKIFCNTVNHIIKTLNRYQLRHPVLDKILSTFKVNDMIKRPKTLTLKRFEISKHFKCKRRETRTVLLDLFKIVRAKKYYTIYDDNILVTIDVKKHFSVRGKYTAFKIMFLLGLLNRRVTGRKYTVKRQLEKVVESPQKTKKPKRCKKSKRKKRKRSEMKHVPISFSIPVYTDDLLRVANDRAKKILELKLRKITYFIVREEFGYEIAESTFRNAKLKNNYEVFSTRTKQDVASYLKQNKIIEKKGYITPQLIVEFLELFIKWRGLKEGKHFKTYKNIKTFVRSLLKYNTDIEKTLEDLGFVYRRLNKKIIANIKQYQENTGVTDELVDDLKPNQTVIVLKELVEKC